MTKRNPTRQLIKATKSARDAEYDYARMRSEIKGVSLGHTGERDLSKMRRGVKKRRKRAQRRMAAPLIREARMNTDTGKWRKVGRYLWVYSVGGYDILVIRPGGIPQGEPGNSVNWDNPDYYLIFIIDPMVGYPTFDIAQGTPDPLPKWATHGSDRFAGDRIISTHRLSASEGTFEGEFARSRMKPFGKVKATAMDFLRWTMSHPDSPQKKGDGTRRIASLMSEEAWSASVKNPHARQKSTEALHAQGLKLREQQKAEGSRGGHGPDREGVWWDLLERNGFEVLRVGYDHHYTRESDGARFPIVLSELTSSFTFQDESRSNRRSGYRAIGDGSRYHNPEDGSREGGEVQESNTPGQDQDAQKLVMGAGVGRRTRTTFLHEGPRKEGQTNERGPGDGN